MSDKEDLKRYFDNDNQKEPLKLPGPDLRNPVWMVTRRQHTEVSPVRVRDADTYEVVPSPYHTRSVTTTERVHVMQTPLNIDIEDMNEDLISSLSPTGNTTKTVFSTTSTHLEGPTQIHGGLTVSGAPLHLGVQMQPESRQTTTVITTTTTTYRVVEASEEVPMETEEDVMSPMTIDLQFLRAMASPQSMHVKTDILITPTSNKNFDYEQNIASLSPKDQNYVIINKTENSNPVSPSSEKTKLIFEYIPYDSKYPEQVKYTGPVAITEKKDELQTIPIEHHVQIYHPTGQSDIPTEVENIHKIGEKRYQKSSIFKSMFKKKRSSEENSTLPEYYETTSNTSDIQDLDELALDDEGNLANKEKIKTDTIKKDKDDFKKNIGYKISQFFKKNQSDEKISDQREILDSDKNLVDNKNLENISDSHLLTAYSGNIITDDKQKNKGKIEKKIIPENVDSRNLLDNFYQKLNEINCDTTEKDKELLDEPIEFYVNIYHPGWYDSVKGGKSTSDNEKLTINSQQSNKGKEYDNKNLQKDKKNNNSFDNDNDFNEEEYIIVENDEVDIQKIDDFEKIFHQKSDDTIKDEQISGISKHDEPYEPANKKGRFSKLKNLFDAKPTDYNFDSKPFSGKLDEIQPSSELTSNSLQQYVGKIPTGFYDKLVEKDKSKKTVGKKEKSDAKEIQLDKEKHQKKNIFGIFKKSHGDYPISEPYTGELEKTKQSSELDDVPLQQYVNDIPTGYYGEQIKKHDSFDNVGESTTREPKETFLEKGKHLKDDIIGVFRKDLSDYPISEPYIGVIENVKKENDLDQEPLNSHVSQYHVGYYSTLEKPKEGVQKIQKEKSDSGDKKGRFAKITSIFSGKPVDYPFDSEPYKGEIDKTKPSQELSGKALNEFVEKVPLGYCDRHIDKDEPFKHADNEKTEESILEKGKHLKDDILGLFKKDYSDYPKSELYTGKLEEIKPISEVSGSPLEKYVESVPSGCYDKLVEKDEPLKTVDNDKQEEILVEKGKHLKDDIFGIFKRDLSDYPKSEPYTGALDNINKEKDLDQEPLNSHVSPYHVGYYLTLEKPKEDVQKVKKEKSDSGDKKGRFAKITSIFSGKSVDYPFDAEPYKGELNTTKPSQELSGNLIKDYVTKVPVGYYDKHIEKDEPIKHVDEDKTRESIIEKGKHLKDDIVGMFKKDYSDYPKSELYTGKLEEIKPISEVSGSPLEKYVESIPSGYYDSHVANTEQLSDVDKDKPEQSLIEKGKQLKDDVLGMFKKDNKDYPASEPYTGVLENVNKVNDIDQEPLNSHVSQYHVGYYSTLDKPEEDVQKIKKEKSDSGDKKGQFSKITSIFSGKSIDYPFDSEPYKGQIDETKPSQELSGNSLKEYVESVPLGYYDKLIKKDEPTKVVEKDNKTEDSLLEKGKHLKDDILGIFKKDYSDYPKSEQYTGKLEQIEPKLEMTGNPLQQHVEKIPHGYYDKPLTIVDNEKTVESALKKEGQHKDNIFRIFRKELSDYPISEPYIGVLDNVNKEKDLDQEPLNSYVSPYHVGYYSTLEKPKEDVQKVKKEKSDSVDRKGRFAKITSIFSGKSVDYPSDAEPYKGELDKTKPSQELSGISLKEYVDTVPLGYYDKPIKTDKPLEIVDNEKLDESILEKGKHLKDDILGMFKKDYSDYPKSEIYTGKLEEIKPISEVSGIPLKEYVDSIPAGYYDKLVKKDEPLKTVSKDETEESLIEKGKHLKDDILGMFKKDYSDYPKSEPYTGALDNINKVNDIDQEPLNSHVSPYHVGYYTTLGKPKEEIQNIPEEKSDSGDKKGQFAKITSLFGRKSVDYPFDSEPYQGELDKTKPSSELSGNSLNDYVDKIPLGYYDRHIEKEEPLKHVDIEPKGESILEKGKHLKDDILGMFKKDFSDYPKSEPYIGQIDEIKPISEVSEIPLTEYVVSIPSGYYDKLVEKNESLDDLEEERLEKPIIEKGKHLKDDILGMFKKDYSDYPKSELYTGTLDNINKEKDIDDEPLNSHVSKYHAGYYTTLDKPKEDAQNIQKEKNDSGDKKGGFAKITNIFGGKFVDYPFDSEPYKGQIDETKPSQELYGNALNKFVDKIPVGYYDKHIEKDELSKNVDDEKTGESLLEKGKHLKDDILGLFKKDYSDYPKSELYTGKLDEIKPISEVSGIPLEKYIDTIPAGYYDKLVKKDEPLRPVDKDQTEESLLEKGKHIKDDIFGLFKRDLSDYPISEPYLGALDNVNKEKDLDQEPLNSHVSQYHVGYYTTLEKPKEDDQKVKKEKSDSGDKQGRFAKITGIFSGKPVDYPSDAEPYKGELDKTKPSQELSGISLEEYVDTVPLGYYDKPIKTDKPLEIVDNEKLEESILEKGKHLKDDILGMFKKDYSDYPKSEPYTGELDEIKPLSEVSGNPLKEYVDSIPSGYYDKLIEKEEPLEIDYKKEKDGSFIEKGKHLKDDILGIFKKDYSDYPKSEPYVGKLDEIKPTNEVSGIPLEKYVDSIPSGYYEKLVKNNEPLTTVDDVKVEESILEKGKHLKDDIIGIFKKELSDYPISERYTGVLDNVKKENDLDQEPLNSHVTQYHVGYYSTLEKPKEDVAKVKKEKSDSADKKGRLAKITSIFSGKSIDYPFDAEPYKGELNTTKPSQELSGNLIKDYVSKVPAGYYDKLIEKDEPLMHVGEEKTGESILEKGKHLKGDILGMFKKDYSDYPKSEPYIGKLEEIKPISEVSGIPLTEYVVSIPAGYYDKLVKKDEPLKSVDKDETEESLLEKGKHLKDDIIGMFKKDFSDYPTSEPYTGVLDNINKVSDIDQEPLNSHVSPYHVGYYSTLEKPNEEIQNIPKEKSDTGDNKGKLAKITSIFSGKSVDYPFDAEPFKGELNTTKPSQELSGQSLNDYVNKVPLGYYDKYVEKKEPLKHDDEDKAGESIIEKGKHLKDDILGMFKKDYSDYPKLEPYTGKIDEIKPLSELSGMPLKEHVESIPSGYYEKLVEITSPSKHTDKDKPEESLIEKGKHIKDEIIGMFKKDFSDYPKSEQYLGVLDNVNKEKDLDQEPLNSHVSQYHVGHYSTLEKPKDDVQQIKEEISDSGDKKERFAKITSIFSGKSVDYPFDAEPYKGQIDETKPSQELSNNLLTEYIDKIPVGYYDKNNEEQESVKITDKGKPEESILEKGKHLKDDIIGMFKKDYSDYPKSEPYTGKLDEIKPISEVSNIPLEEYIVNIPSGYYDKLIEKNEPLKTINKDETEESPIEKGKHLKDDILGLFKRDLSDYPVSEPYTGILDNVNKEKDLDEEPLNSHVSQYHVGYYSTLDKPEEDVQKIKKEKSDSGDKKGRFAKITSIFSGKSVDYPFDSEPYKGELNTTKPSQELSGNSLNEFVEKIPKGYYDKYIQKDEPSKVIDKDITGESIIEKGRHLKDDILGIFKKDYSDYPKSEPSTEVLSIPLEEYVESIPSGYYEKIVKKNEPFKVVDKDKTEESILEKGRHLKDDIIGMFKIDYSDYPKSEPFTGKLDEIKPLSDVSSIPLKEYVESIPSGYYDKLVENVEPLKSVDKEKAEESLLEKGKHLKDDILGMFKKDYTDYQKSEPYTGKIDEIKPMSDVSGIPLKEYVDSIPAGYYDKLVEKDETFKTIKQDEIEESLLEKGKHLKDDVLRMFRKDYSDYPISEPYLGVLDNVNKEKDLDQEPLNSHVSHYHVGYYTTLEKPTDDVQQIKKEISDSGDKKGKVAKIISIFSEKQKDYPFDTEPYQGELDKTKPSSELSGNSLNDYVEKIPLGYYDKHIEKEEPIKHIDKEKAGESLLEKGKHLKDDILGMFKKDYSDYPKSEPYTGKLDEIKPISEVLGIPLEEYIVNIPSGYYDKLVKKDEPLRPVDKDQTEESLLEKGKHLKDDIIGIFKKDYADYPKSEPYTGTVDNIDKVNDLDNEPLNSHVSQYHVGYYSTLEKPVEDVQTIQKEITDSKDKKSKFAKITTIFSGKYDDYPFDHEPYKGEIDQTKPSSQLIRNSLNDYVDNVPLGYYDKDAEKIEPSNIADGGKTEESLLEKGKHIKDDILGMFKKDYSDYPKSEPYTGKLDEIKPISDISGTQLKNFVDVIPIGHYDKHIEKIDQFNDISRDKPEESLLEKGKHLKDDIIGLFKKDYSDYPISEPYLGSLDNVNKVKDLNQEPLNLHVSQYHVGYYSTLDKPKEDVQQIERETSDYGDKKGRFAKITSIFSGRPVDYPFDSEPYEGQLDETKPSQELSGNLIKDYVSKVPAGYYDKLIEKHEPLKQVDEEKTGESLLEKGKHIKDDIVGMFKKDYSDYPKSEPYTGKLEEIKPISEVSGIPLKEYVEIIPLGYYEKIVEITEPKKDAVKDKPEESLIEKGKHFKDDIIGIFKKDYKDYPISERYTGVLDNVEKENDLDQEPLNSHVSQYYIGYYSTLEKPKEDVQQIQNESSDTKDKKSKFTKITSIFSGKSVDYPFDSEPYKGELDKTKPSQELTGNSLNEYVDNVPLGYYDKHIDKDEPIKHVDEDKAGESIIEKGKHLKDDIIGMFKKDYSDYPKSEPYIGKLDEIKPISEVSGIPFEKYVDSIPPGYYDKLVEKKEPLKAIEKDKTEESLLEKGKHIKDDILGMFKKDYSDYPKSEPYIGKLSEIKPISEVSGIPLEKYVDNIPSGYYDKLVEKKEPLKAIEKDKTEESLLEKGKHIKDDIIGMFKKDYSDYPKSEPYTGKLSEIKPISEVSGIPLEKYVDNIPSGYYEQLMEINEPLKAVEDDKKEESFLEKGKHIKDDIIGMFKKNYPDYPISEPYLGELDITNKVNDLDNEPLHSHVSKYHVGYYSKSEEPKDDVRKIQKEKSDSGDKKGRFAKLTSIFSEKHKDYPFDSEPYNGQIDETKPLLELTENPLKNYIEKIPLGYYDKPNKKDKLPSNADKSITEESLLEKGKHLKDDILGIFKKDHKDYPISEPYKGVLDSMNKVNDLDNEPLKAHVTDYHIGYYSTLEKPKEEAKKIENDSNDSEVRKRESEEIRKVFDRKNADYPSDSEPYTGPLFETKPLSEISEKPLEHFIETIPVGFYYKHNKEDEPLNVADKEKTKESLFEKGKHLKDDILEMFKKDYSDYPKSEPYLGVLDSVNREKDLEKEPLNSHVSPYHAGYYSTLEKAKEEVKTIPNERSDLGDNRERFAKITSIFSGKSADYPFDSEPYKGELNTTKPSQELSGNTLKEFVENIPLGYYDKHSEKDETLKVADEEKTGESIIEKGKHLKDDILGMFKKDFSDYPKSEPYTGKLDEIKPLYEISEQPLKQHVERIPSGYYDNLVKKDEQLKPTDKIKKDESLLEKGKHLKDDVLGMFKKDYKDYPVSEPYLGVLDNVKKENDLDQEPLNSHVSQYHVGYYSTLEKPKEVVPKVKKEKSDPGDKQGRFAKITSIFSGKSVDYPFDAEPYKGQIGETKPSEELSGNLIKDYVSKVPTGYYDKLIEKDEPLKQVDEERTGESIIEKGKHLKDDILGMFRKDHSDYPKSEPFTGQLDEIKPMSDVSGIPLKEYVDSIPAGYYDKLVEKDEPLKTVKQDETEESLLEKGKHLKDDVLRMFKKDFSDYPTSEPYVGELEHINKDKDIDDEPINSHVSQYHVGYYTTLDKPNEEIQNIPKEKSDTGDNKGKFAKITSIFSGKSVDYPFDSEPYKGQINETKPSQELSGNALNKFVDKVPIGYYDKHVEKHEPLKHVDEEKTGESILEKGKHLKDDILGMFKKDYSDYPKSEPYIGKLDEIKPISEVSGLPLKKYVDSIPAGYYDKLVKKDEPLKSVDKDETEESLLEKGKHLKDDILGMFKKDYSDYPKSEAYVGVLDNTNKEHDLDNEPLNSHVSHYHIGYYTTLEKPTDDVQQIKKEISDSGDKKGQFAKITSLFGGKSVDYPFDAEPYKGEIDETKPSQELSGNLIKDYVSKVPAGHYDNVIEKDEPLKQVDEEKTGESILEKGKHLKDDILGMFKKDFSDYPKSEPYTGKLDELKPLSEVSGIPLKEYVDSIPSGYYEKLVEMKEPIKITNKDIPEESLLEKGKHLKDDIIGMFKKEHSDYPKSEPYIGKLDEIKPLSEISEKPLKQYIEKIPSGHYERLVEKNEPLKTDDNDKVEESLLEKGKHLKDDIVGIFKKDFSDYPTSEPFIGVVENINKENDLDQEPLHSHVSQYHVGYYSTIEEPQEDVQKIQKEVSDTKSKKGRFAKITSIFSAKSSDYPFDSKPYKGQIDETKPSQELSGYALNEFVEKVPVGYYDKYNQKIEPLNVVDKDKTKESILEKGKHLKDDILGMFKKDYSDYPKSEPFIGKLDEIKPLSEISEKPLKQYVEKIPYGYYDKHNEKDEPVKVVDTEKTEESILEKGKHLKDDVIAIFKKDFSEYPKSEPYTGKINEIKPISEVSKIPLENYVDSIPSGYYDKLVEKKEPLKAIEKDKTEESLLEKGKHLKDDIIGMFKKDYSDYPKSEPYTGKLDEIKPLSEVSRIPLKEYVESVPSGYYDKLVEKDEPLKHADNEKTEESILEKGKHLKDDILGMFKKDYSDYPKSEPYVGSLESVKKENDIDQEPLNSHVTQYHVGYYLTLEKPKDDVQQIKEEISDSGDKKGQFAKITSIFSGKSVDYPFDTEPYKGQIDETKPLQELTGNPLNDYVEKIPSGYYDKHIEKDEPLDIVENEKIEQSLLEKGKHIKDDIIGIFRKDYSDYPKSEPYLGTLDNVNKEKDLDNQPLNSHVTQYHVGYYSTLEKPKDDVQQIQKEKSDSGNKKGQFAKITNIFSGKSVDYPIDAEPYSGQLDKTKPSLELSGTALNEYVDKVPLGYYDKYVQKDEPLKSGDLEKTQESFLEKDYPKSEPFTGKLDEIKPIREITTDPLQQHVKNIPSGYYDTIVDKDKFIKPVDEKETKEPKDSILKIRKHFKDDILGIFKKDYKGYPVSEPYTGELEKIKLSSELSEAPLEQHIDKFPSEISYIVTKESSEKNNESPNSYYYYEDQNKMKPIYHNDSDKNRLTKEPLEHHVDLNFKDLHNNYNKLDQLNYSTIDDKPAVVHDKKTSNIKFIYKTNENIPTNETINEQNKNKFNNNLDNNFENNTSTVKDYDNIHGFEKRVNFKKEQPSVYLTAPMLDSKSTTNDKYKENENIKNLSSNITKSPQLVYRETYSSIRSKPIDNVMKITDSFAPYQNLHKSLKNEKNNDLIDFNETDNITDSNSYYKKGRSISSPPKRHIEFTSSYSDSVPLSQPSTYDDNKNNSNYLSKSKCSNIFIDPKSFKITSENNLSSNNNESNISPEYTSHNVNSLPSTYNLKNQTDFQYNYLVPTTEEYSNLHNNLHPSRSLSPSFEVYLRKYDAKMKNRELVNSRPLATSTPIRNTLNIRNYKPPSTDNTSFKKFVETYDRESSENKRRRHKGWTTITETTTITYSKRLDSTINRFGQNQNTVTENVLIKIGKAIHDHIADSPPRIFDRDGNKRDIMLQTDPNYKGPLNHPINYSRLYHRSRSESRPQYFTSNNTINYNRNGRSTERYPEVANNVSENQQIKRRFEYEQAIRNAPIELSTSLDKKTRSSTEPLYSMQRIQRYDIDLPSTIPPPNSLHYQHSGLVEHDKSLNNSYLDLPPIEEIGKTSFEQRYSFTTDLPNDNELTTNNKDHKTSNAPLRRARTNAKHYCNVI
uniref:63 kDa sperm flagellar membrane protein n=1 Tax=Strongyloides stercoralis TaxID=6248 RepID=A0A0K0EP58_STRER